MHKNWGINHGIYHATIIFRFNFWYSCTAFSSLVPLTLSMAGDKSHQKTVVYQLVMTVSMKNLQQEGKIQLKLGNSIKQTFLCLLQKVILWPGVVKEREFATEIQETEAQILCTIKNPTEHIHM